MATNGFDEGPSRLTLGALLRRRGFWLNVVITLLVTSWVPLLTIQPRFETFAPVVIHGGGNTKTLAPAPPPPAAGGDRQPQQVIEGKAKRVPVYACYAGLYRSIARGNMGGRAFRLYGGAVAAHLLACFTISLAVWFLVLRGVEK